MTDNNMEDRLFKLLTIENLTTLMGILPSIKDKEALNRFVEWGLLAVKRCVDDDIKNCLDKVVDLAVGYIIILEQEEKLEKARSNK